MSGLLQSPASSKRRASSSPQTLQFGWSATEVENSGDDEQDQDTEMESSSRTPNFPISPLTDQISASDWTTEILDAFKIPFGNDVLEVSLDDFFPTLRDTNGITTTTTIVAPPVGDQAVVAPPPAVGEIAAQQNAAQQQQNAVPPRPPFAQILLQELNRLQTLILDSSEWNPLLSPNPPALGHEVAAKDANRIASAMKRLTMNTFNARVGSLLPNESTVDALVFLLLTAFDFCLHPLELIAQPPFPLFMNTMVMDRIVDSEGKFLDFKLIDKHNPADAKADFAIYSRRNFHHMLIVEDKKDQSDYEVVYPQAIAEAVAAAQHNMRTKVLHSTGEDPLRRNMTPTEYKSDQTESIYVVTVCGSLMQFYRVTFTRHTLVKIAWHDTIPTEGSTVQKLHLPVNGILRISFDLHIPEHRPALFTALHNLKAYADQIW